jgi:hypothetical protein
MKGSSSCSWLIPACKAAGIKFTANVATVAGNLVLSASVGRKFHIIITTEGIKTSSEVIVKEVQPFWNEENAHT